MKPLNNDAELHAEGACALTSRRRDGGDAPFERASFMSVDTDRHPLAGDEKYGDADVNRQMRSVGLKRLFLHAHTVAFEDHERHRNIHVSAPLSADLRKLIQQLEENPIQGKNKI